MTNDHATEQVRERVEAIYRTESRRVFATLIRLLGDFDLAEEEYLQILSGKTAALCACCCRLGAHHGGADDEVTAAFGRFGEQFGIAFQIVDDVLDITADLATLGKDPGSDREAGKTTFVDLLGVDGAKARARKVMQEGIDALSPLGVKAEALRALGRYTVERDR